MSETKFYTTREAADILGVTLSTIQNWESSGYLQAWKTAGGHRRILRESVERILDGAGRRDHGGGPSRSRAGQGRRLLIAGGDPAVLSRHARHAATWTHPSCIETARDAYETMLKIGRHCPDVLLLNLPFPALNDAELFLTLAREPGCQKMRLLLVSDQSADQLRARMPIPDHARIFPHPASDEDWETLAAKLKDELEG